MANTPQNPNYKPGVGRLVTDRYDFAGHYNGTEFRHNATQIDILNPALVPGGATTVELALDVIQGFIEGQADVGGGFITVGDGYDTYHAADGYVNFDNTIPPLDTLLNPIFAAIVAYQNSNTPVPLAYERIKDGGVVVIKAGTYIVQNTISIPPGITLMGEGYGTKIVNFTSITVPVNYPNSPPFVNPVGTPSPIFKILADASRLSDGPAIGTDKFMFADVTKITNMVICDNFVEPTIYGEIFYLAPQNRTTLNPSRQSSFSEALVLQEMGSSLILDNVFMIGRASVAPFSTGGNAYQVTQGCTGFAHVVDRSALVVTGTILKIKNCVIDGFQLVTSFATVGGSEDYLEVDGCQIRDYGIGVDATVFNTTDNNIKITNNTIYCEGFSYWGLTPTPPSEQMLLWVTVGSTYTGPNAPAPVLQQRSKILVAGNNINLDKNSNVANGAFNLISDALSTNCIPTYATTLAYGNSMNGTAGDVFDVEVDNVPAMSLGSNSTTINGNLAISNITVTNAATLGGAVYNNVNLLNNSVTGWTGIGVSPIVLTIGSTNHMSTGDIVYVHGANGTGANLNSNGLWVVTVLTPTTFRLNNSSGPASLGLSGITTGGTAYILQHSVNTLDYSFITPTPSLALLPQFPIFESIESDFSAYLGVTSGVAYISLQSGSETNAISSLQGAALVGQSITVSNTSDPLLTGTFTMTSYSPNISGGGASIVTTSSGLLHTLTGGSGFVSTLVGQPITITGSASNNGTFVINQVISATSLNWRAGGANGPDSNNGAINWYIPGIATFNTSASNETDGGNYTIGDKVNIILPTASTGRNIIVKDGGSASPTIPVVITTPAIQQTFEGADNDLTSYPIVVPSTSVSLIGVDYGFGFGVWYII